MFILSPGNLGGGRQGTGGPFEPSGIRAPRHDQKPVGNPGVSGFPGPRDLEMMDCYGLSAFIKWFTLWS